MPIDTQDLMKRVRRIKVVTAKWVDEFVGGEYHSVFKGRGIEFDEVREYVPGDDVRAIDWNVTARMGHPFVKRFCEERELTILFLVDVSGSMIFGSGTRSKAETAAELTGLLALSAIQNQDKVGLIRFTDRIERFLPPRRGRTAVLRLVREALTVEETRRGTHLAGALQFLNRVLKRRAVVFLISDFMAEGYEKDLRVAARHHDVIVCPVSDPRERALPSAGLIELADPETGELILADTGSRRLREAFGARSAADAEARDRLFQRLKLDRLPISTDRPFLDDVRRLFLLRRRRLRHG